MTDRATAEHETLDVQLDQHLAGADPRVRQRIEEWARKLIDLSRRNRLLVYKPTKRSTLVFQRPGPDVILERLLDGRTWSIYEPPRIPVADSSRPEALPRTLEEGLRERPPAATEVVADQRDPNEIERSLTTIGRRARAEFEDRGTHTLHLAWSLLRWTDPGSQEAWVAPVLLVPLELKKDARQRYELIPTEDDATFNPALRVKLENDFGVRLPEMDIELTTPSEVLSGLRAALDPLPITWEIQPHAAIGLFSFAREPMYRDLVEHAAIIAESPVVQSLAMGEPVPALIPYIDIEVPGESQLDAAQPPAEVFSVIDADSSQRQAIEAAIRGQSFVLFGPPGTGKSQTISNIIAEFVARGRSVLFVSEKMAALEVVSNRLRAAELGDLLLELHSAKSSRTEVAKQLATSLNESVASDDRKFKAAQDVLLRERPELTDYVEALHEIRIPLESSVFDVMAEVATLNEAPALPGGDLDAPKARLANRNRAESIAARLAEVWAPVIEGDEFVWRDVALISFAAAERQRVHDLLRACDVAVAQVAILERAICAALHIPAASSQVERRSLGGLRELTRDRHAGPMEWLTTDDLTPHRGVIERWRAITEGRLQAVQELAAAYGSAWADVPANDAQEASEALKKLDSALDRTFDAAPMTESVDVLDQAASRVVRELDDLEPHIARLRALLGVSALGDGLHDVANLIEVARISQARHRPPSIWLSRARLDDADNFERTHGQLYTEQQEATSSLLEFYEEGIFDLPIDSTLDRMHRHHGKWWNLLRRSYRRDRRAIVELTKTRRIRPEVLTDLEKVRSIQHLRAAIRDLDPEASRVLGPYAAGLAISPTEIQEALGSARRLIDLPHASTDWDLLARKVTFESPFDPSVDRDADQVSEAVGRVARDLELVAGQASPGRVESIVAASRQDLRNQIQIVASSASGVRSAVERFASLRAGTSPSSTGIRREIHLRLFVDDTDRQLAATHLELSALFHDRWNGYQTDWSRLSAALDWSLAVREAYAGEVLPRAVAESITSGEAGRLDWDEYLVAVDLLEQAATDVAALYSDGAAAVAKDALTGNLSNAKAFARVRAERVDQIDVWIRFCNALCDLDDIGWAKFGAAAVDGRLQAAKLGAAMSRAWLSSWLRSVFASDPRLSDFTRGEHQRAVSSFRRADLALIEIARERVIKQYEAGKPVALTMQGGEPAIVRREAAKRRRVLPVRSLLAAIPNLLPRIKPCLMMSPLSVSHFLAPTLRFDLVVFDEASQVRPEDAINCIYRGRQVIVAGDPKQLPPTDFFRLSATIESDLDLDAGVDDFDSVLDLATGSGFVSRPLRWHYRSRDDSLIAFSNQLIYDGALVTFPSPARSTDQLGVSFVHCPEGVFDRGRTARNIIEAAKVVDILADEIRRDPANTMGVVAFSVAQQQAIEDEWAIRLRIEPELEELAGTGRLQGLFIKNLETVQGDERDVIVFSVGYGRDDGGRLLMNFGPLNRQGGWRRLNVAVTRARRKVIVVSSIRADEITTATDAPAAGMPRGPDLLKAYLEYAEHGLLPVRAMSKASRGPAESPFESEVASAIRDLGWEVVTQVGTSGYRIDLGVVSKTDATHFVAGVECDGMMYHSAKTARDRDRLRQGVLEGLGWRIYRIWSQDWFEHRGAAIERLRVELESAETTWKTRSASTRNPGPQQALPLGQTAPEQPTDLSRPRTVRPATELRDKSDAASLPWTEPFPTAELPAYARTWMEFHDYGMVATHASMIGALVDVEGPLHADYAAARISRHFGLQRVGNRMVTAIDGAIAQAERSGRIVVQGEFLWPVPHRELVRVRVPVPENSDTHRTVDRIPPEEIDLAVVHLVEAAVAIDQASLRTAVARVLGFDRTGDQIGERIDARIASSVQAGKVVAADGLLTVPTRSSGERA